MRQGLLTVLIFAVGAICFAQNRPYTSVGGYGNILYPGVGHAPNANPNPVPFGTRLGNTISGYPVNAPRVNHPAHGRTAVVPYPVIVGGYYGGGYYGGYGDAPPPQQQYDQEAPPPIVSPNGAPSVVINQTFIPDRGVPVLDYGGPPDAQPQDQNPMHLYEGPKPPPYAPARRAASDDLPTLYLIAFKDHSIVSALGYWVESGNLHYVSAEHTLNQASLDLIDRDLSQRLNDERSVEFKLPKTP